MSDGPDPPDKVRGEYPYETLGVDENDPLDKIESEYDELLTYCKDLRRKGKKQDDDEKIQKAVRGTKEVQEAWEWIKENRGSLRAGQDVTLEVLGNDYTVGSPIEVKVTGDSGPVETVVKAGDEKRKKEEKTGSDGKAEFVFDKKRTINIKALTEDGNDDDEEAVTVKRKQVQLSFGTIPDEVEVEEETTITVQGDGGSEKGVTVETGNKELGTTGANGKVKTKFDSTGTKTIEARKSDDDTATYSKCEETLKVTEEKVSLEVTVKGSNHEYGDDITVHVNAEKQAVEGAEVTGCGDSGTTDKKGKTGLTLQRAGDGMTIEATKPDSKDKIYEKATEEIDVSKKQGNLRIQDIDGKLMEGSEIEVKVVDGGGKPLEDATIRTEWRPSGEKAHEKKTNGSGTAALKLNDSGKLKVEASKQDNKTDYGKSTEIIEIEEFSRELCIECPGVADKGEEITVRVTDAGGDPIKGAVVTSTGQQGEWETDGDGKVTFSLAEHFRDREIRVRKDGSSFTEERETISVI